MDKRPSLIASVGNIDFNCNTSLIECIYFIVCFSLYARQAFESRRGIGYIFTNEAKNTSKKKSGGGITSKHGKKRSS